MKSKIRALLAVGILAVLGVSWLAAGASAQGSGYEMSWWTVDAGGAVSDGGGYTLAGTAGQPDTAVLGGGGYTLEGGFWRAGPDYGRIYLPLVVRNG